MYALKFRPNKNVGGIGPARGIEKGSMSEHTIASSQHMRLLRKRITYQREIIVMLIEEVTTLVSRSLVGSLSCDLSLLISIAKYQCGNCPTSHRGARLEWD